MSNILDRAKDTAQEYADKAKQTLSSSSTPNQQGKL